MLGTDAHLKLPLGHSLHQFAQRKVQEAIQKLGKSLPCTVAAVVGNTNTIVKVNFEVNAAPWTLPQVTVPIAAPPYIRYPVAVGDKGLCISADARLGGMTGLGSGTPDMTQPGNLTALAFLWLGNTNLAAALDPTALELWHNVLVTQDHLSFFGASKVTKQSITGALSAVTDANAKAVLTSIIQALTNYGLTTNSTS